MLVVGQAAITVAVALVYALTSGVPAAIAAGIGGGIGVVASLTQVLSGFRRGTAGDPKAIARGFYRGEALKIAVTVALFVLALRGRHFAPGPMLAGYVATFVAYWVALARTLRAG